MDVESPNPVSKTKQEAVCKYKLPLLACFVLMFFAVVYLKDRTTLLTIQQLINSRNRPEAPLEAPPAHMIPRDEPLMQLDVVITFPALFDTQLKFKGDGYITEKRKKQRMNEYIYCLKRTLSHRYVSKVHLLYDQVVLPPFINSQIDEQLKVKLSFQKVNDSVKALTAFDYIYSHLQGRLVMLKQADTYPGDGLDLLNKNLMRRKRLMYALTRRGQLEEVCDMGNIKNFASSNSCHDKKYRGSHDAYIFVPNGKLPLNVQKVLKDKYNYSYGIDNLTIWIFRTILKHKVLNPCKVISIFHYHCSNVRNYNYKKRTDDKKTRQRAPPTNKLL